MSGRQAEVLLRSDARAGRRMSVRMHPSGVRFDAVQPEGVLEEARVHVVDGHVLMQGGEQ